MVRPRERLARGAYRVAWHSVSTQDGHALEGSFSFGVRTPAVGGEHALEQSPLARHGWVRVIARALMYATLLVFCGALLLGVVLGGSGRSWVVPAGVSASDQVPVEAVAARERALLADLGFFTAAAAVLSAISDGADAAGGLSGRGLEDYLLGSQSGFARLCAVVLVLLAGLIAVRRPRAAAAAAALALGAVAFSGHASSASPRALTVLVDWVHLLAAAVWLGGVALIVVVWGPALRRSGVAGRLAVARHVLPVFGRAALPAFGLVVLTGAVSALVELGSVSALWETDYGRALIVKMTLVALIAAVSSVHALRLRPRLLAANPHPDVTVERRHWRLLRAEPVLGIAVVGVVALLVAFPLPPRQLAQADEARAATPACNPCPLPSPRPDELAVAEQGGASVVAAWLRRTGDRLAGEVRVLDLEGRPTGSAFEVLGTRQRSCGRGCRRFTLAPARDELAVAVPWRGRRYVARLGTRWRAGPAAAALSRRLLVRAQRTMRALRSVRETERVSSIPGLYATSHYRLKAPDRLAYRTNGNAQTVAIGATQWDRPEPTFPLSRLMRIPHFCS